jgi:HSP20 family protein
VDASSIGVTVEHKEVSVSAQGCWQPAEDDRIVASERPHSSFTQQLFLGEGIDADRVGPATPRRADRHHPVSEKARRVEISAKGHQQAIEAGSTAS